MNVNKRKSQSKKSKKRKKTRKNKMQLILLFLGFTGSKVWSIDPTKAQSASNALVFMLQAPGNCLQSITDLPADAPSKNLAALWIRASFHEASTFDPDSLVPAGTDGSLVGTLNATQNAGLNNTLANRFVPNRENISDADLLALGGIVSVKHCGGPNIPFRGGRKDTASFDHSIVNRIPDGNASLLTVKSVFKRMGLDPIDLAVLVTGSQSMGGVHGKISPMLTKEEFIPFDDTPGVFDNHVFQSTLKGHCPVPVDCEIAQDEETRPFIEIFASNQDAFFKQYAKSFQKMIEITSPHPLDSSIIQLSIPVHEHLEKEGTVKSVEKSKNDSLTFQVSFVLMLLTVF